MASETHCMRDPSVIGCCAGPGQCSCECTTCLCPNCSTNPCECPAITSDCGRCGKSLKDCDCEDPRLVGYQ